jgi:hypothetical protein
VAVHAGYRARGEGLRVDKAIKLSGDGLIVNRAYPCAQVPMYYLDMPLGLAVLVMLELWSPRGALVGRGEVTK